MRGGCGEGYTLVEHLEREIVKIGDRVGFGPQSDPSAGVRRVADTKQNGVIEERFYFAAALHNTKFVPSGSGEGAIDLLHNLLHPIHDAIDTDFLLHQTRSQQIVISVVLRPPQEPAAEVGFSGHGEIGHLDIEVGTLGALEQEEFVRLVRPLGL